MIELRQIPGDPAAAITLIKSYSAERDDLNANSAPIPRSAFLAARRGIEEGEARHVVDKNK